MKVALIGAGKTGSKVVEILGDATVTVFTRAHQIDVASLDGHDVVISFLPGDAFCQLIDTLIESRIPVVTGSTGFQWPTDIQQRLVTEKITWIYAHNFSLGMVLIKEMIQLMSRADQLLNDVQFNLHEVHHTSKIDAPSGTALSWRHWLDKPVEITSERTDDVIGEHELLLSSDFEEIRLSHSATDRKIFASGAIWAAKELLNGSLTFGLHEYAHVAKQKMQNKKY